MTSNETHSGTSTGVLEDRAAQELTSWATVVWDDPVNLMDYVVYVFETYFGYSNRRAEALMYQVHYGGKAVVSTGNRERMEQDVLAMQNYSLWATLERA